MNLILLDDDATTVSLPGDDGRVVHIRTVLRKSAGDTVRVGCPNGPLGEARIESDEAPRGGMRLAVNWLDDPAPPAPLPVDLLIGLPRPQTARKILFEATTLGAHAITFVGTALGEKSYATSSLWTSDEWDRLRRRGAEQARATWLPAVTVLPHLGAALDDRPAEATMPRYVLDLADDPAGAGYPSLVTVEVPREGRLLLAIGPERGWTARERDRLAAEQFAPVSLGRRVLRTETATIAALGVLAANG